MDVKGSTSPVQITAMLNSIAACNVSDSLGENVHKHKNYTDFPLTPKVFDQPRHAYCPKHHSGAMRLVHIRMITALEGILNSLSICIL